MNQIIRKNSWFKPKGWIYYPVSIMGWIITLFIAAIFIHDLLFVGRGAHSVSDLSRVLGTIFFHMEDHTLSFISGLLRKNL